VFKRIIKKSIEQMSSSCFRVHKNMPEHFEEHTTVSWFKGAAFQQIGDRKRNYRNKREDMSKGKGK